MKLLDWALARVGLRRIHAKREVNLRLVGNPEHYRAIAQAVNRAMRETQQRHPQ